MGSAWGRRTPPRVTGPWVSGHGAAGGGAFGPGGMEWGSSVAPPGGCNARSPPPRSLPGSPGQDAPCCPSEIRAALRAVPGWGRRTARGRPSRRHRPSPRHRAGLGTPGVGREEGTGEPRGPQQRFPGPALFSRSPPPSPLTAVPPGLGVTDARTERSAAPHRDPQRGLLTPGAAPRTRPRVGRGDTPAPHPSAALSSIPSAPAPPAAPPAPGNPPRYLLADVQPLSDAAQPYGGGGGHAQSQQRPPGPGTGTSTGHGAAAAAALGPARAPAPAPRSRPPPTARPGPRAHLPPPAPPPPRPRAAPPVPAPETAPGVASRGWHRARAAGTEHHPLETASVPEHRPRGRHRASSL